MLNFPSLDFNHGENAVLDDDEVGFEPSVALPSATAIDHATCSPPTCGGRWATWAARHHRRKNTAALAMGYLAHVVAMEEISRASRRWASPMARIEPCVNQIRRNAARRRSTRYLPKAHQRRHVGALAMGAPGSGSDVVSMRLRADRQGNGASERFVLNSNKMWITNGPEANTLVVYAKTDVQAGPKGITRS
jgi:isovaleryl-CoA dehydrogenase